MAVVLAVLFLALSAIAIIYVLGIRSKSSTVRDVARRFHRGVGNPLQMRSAGASGTYASVIRHRGRKTGRTYETPVWAARTEDGFVIAIVYGARTDWLKNVLGSGAAAIVHRGDTYRVDQPEIVPMESARPYFPAALQRIHRRLRIDRCLRVRRSEVANTSPRSEQDRSLSGRKGGHDEAAEWRPCDPVPEEQALHGGGDPFDP
jgi:deazaflavin-dependent oxidoreductase (nitroreductase family)